MEYKLYDLDVTTIGEARFFNCSHKAGEGFYVRGENIVFKKGTEKFSHYALASILPYLAAKQRATDTNDWMSFESDITCPDPRCQAVFRITRTNRMVYQYAPIK